MEIEINGLQWSTILDALEVLEKANSSRKDECEALRQHLFTTRDKAVAAIKTPPRISIGAAYGIAPTANEQTEFDVILESFESANRIPILKVVRELTGLPLAAAIAVVNSVPTTLKKGLNRIDCQECKTELEKVGAKVLIR